MILGGNCHLQSYVTYFAVLLTLAHVCQIVVMQHC